MHSTDKLAAIATLAIGWLFSLSAAAADNCGQVVSVQGAVEIQRAGQPDWAAARIDAQVCEGDRLRVGPLGRAALLVGPSALIRVEQNTVLSVRVSAEATEIELQSGAVYSISRFPRRYDIKTPYVNAGVEGTEFLVTLERDQAQVAVYEGRVVAEDLIGERGARRTLASGQVASFARGAAPAVTLLINPADAVQWALYYPPLDPQSTGESIFELPDCEGTPAPERAPCFTRRAGKLLRLGRVDRAERDIQNALALTPDDADALALSAVIRVVKNDKAGALELAQRAVARDGRSVPALIALSYALQAYFRLEEALQAATKATELEPANSVAQARRAELLLSVGRIQDAEAAAGAAVKANPADSRARVVLGFAQLARLDTARAREQLLQAAALDPSDALAHLGLGLATIKGGKLAEGRGEIEIAVALDPQNALLRSYLGKAYSDELRDELAGVQLERAKQLDPRDPTPWFYNAIRLQALNRPGEALVELEQSIRRNDNREVYRSRMLLDEDQAARAASRARIYSDLGFDELALSDAMNAVLTDPGAFAAHRFLAEAYLLQNNFEVARVAETLQSQLLQPVNAATLPPRLQQIRSPILAGTGPITPSFQEFNPLFARDRHSLSVSGVAGSADTWADEIIYGYYHGRRSVQLAQSIYDTNGFRPNADLRQDYLRAFYQEDIDPQMSFQLEATRQKTVNGDTRFQFDPNNFSPAQRTNLETNQFRVGGRYGWQPESLIIGSFIAQRETLTFKDSIVQDPVQLDAELNAKNRSGRAEMQYQGRGARWDVIAGGGLYERKVTGDASVTTSFSSIVVDERTDSVAGTLRSRNAYVYSQLGRPSGVRLVIGASLDDAKNTDFANPREDQQFSPKLGAIVPLGRATIVRVAAFRGLVKTVLADTSPSIEPTQVAGFNQVFDDPSLTSFWRYGAGIDHSWSPRTHAGLELTQRDVEAPVAGGFPIEERREWFNRAYFSRLFTDRTAAGAEARVERIDRPPTVPLVATPTHIDTLSFPLTLSYHRSLFFMRARLTFVSQEVESADATGLARGERRSDTFKVFDLSFGTRLPQRRGILSLDIKNLFNEKFVYSDTMIDGFARVPLYAPERAVYGRVQLSF